MEVPADGVGVAVSLASVVEVDSTVVDLEEVEDLVETAVVVVLPVEVTGAADEVPEAAAEETVPEAGTAGDDGVAELDASVVLGTGTGTPGVMVAMEICEYDVPLRQMRLYAYLHRPE